MSAAIPLEGLYFHLVRSGFPLSVRDFRDAVLALQRGYGSPRRDDLRWLCETLWARTDQEVSRLDRLFREFPWPSDQEVGEATGSVGGQRPRKKASRSGAEARTAGIGEAAAALEFAAPSESGVGLPSAAAPDRPEEVFIFTPRPLVSLRSLIVAWRRFRLARRSGPRVELDIDATVAAQSRHRFLVEPVLLPARRNQARLVVLMDAGHSMAAWRHMNSVIAESLDRSRLASTALYYFDNTLGDEVYGQDTVSRPVEVEAALRAHSGSALLIVSEAGAACSPLDRDRIAGTRAFVNQVKEHWRPIAWLNPMPRPRWAGTTAASIARLPDLCMLPFTEDGLIQAVDYLRGKRD